MLTAEDIKKANDGLPTVDVKNKDYVMVQNRVTAFRSICPSGGIDTTILSMENGIVTIQAKIYDENDHLLASGTAQEKESSSFINKTSYVENCETSAVGRALGMLGIGIDASMASAEEVANAIINQDEDKKSTKKEPASTADSKASTDSDDEERRKYRQQIIALGKEQGMNAQQTASKYKINNDTALSRLKEVWDEMHLASEPQESQQTLEDEFAAIDEDVPF